MDFSWKLSVLAERDQEQISLGEGRSSHGVKFRLLQDVQSPHRVPELQIIPEFFGDVVESFFCPLPSSKILVHDHDVESSRLTPAREHFRWKVHRNSLPLSSSSGNWVSSALAAQEISDVHRGQEFFLRQRASCVSTQREASESNSVMVLKLRCAWQRRTRG